MAGPLLIKSVGITLGTYILPLFPCFVILSSSKLSTWEAAEHVFFTLTVFFAPTLLLIFDLIGNIVMNYRPFWIISLSTSEILLRIHKVVSEINPNNGGSWCQLSNSRYSVMAIL